jgi:hypothetical protein
MLCFTAGPATQVVDFQNMRSRDCLRLQNAIREFAGRFAMVPIVNNFADGRLRVQRKKRMSWIGIFPATSGREFDGYIRVVMHEETEQE